MRNPIAFFLLIFVVVQNSIAQSWLPIPNGQTSYFSISGSNQILPMKTDQMFPGGTGDFYMIYGQFIEDEFDTCAWAVWHPSPNLNGLPECDFKMFIDRGFQVGVFGVEHEFEIPIHADFGDEIFYVDDHSIRYDTITEMTFLGQTDSVKIYTINHVLFGSLGTIKLSKNHGLIEFLSFRDLEMPTGILRNFSLVGYEVSGIKVGETAPKSADYLPYSLGDKLVFEHKYWVSGNFTFTEVTEYHHLILTSFDTTSLKGIATIYDHQGFLLSIDSNYVLNIAAMLSEIGENLVSVPFISSSIGPYLLASDRLFSTQDSGYVANIGGYEAAFCDSNGVVDGYAQSEIYSTKLGLLWKRNGGFSPPTTWKLYAADAAFFNYGTWPTWLGIEESTRSVVSIYPNPTNDKVYLEGKVDFATVTLMDLAGKVVFKQDLNLPNQIYLDELTSGIYFLQVSSKEGFGEIHKVVKK